VFSPIQTKTDAGNRLTQDISELALSLRDSPQEHVLPRAGAIEITADDFAAVYIAKFDRIVGQLCRMGVDRLRAVDAVQDAFLRCWQRRDQLRDKICLSGWVLISAINRAYSLARRDRWLVQWPENFQPSVAFEVDDEAIDLYLALDNLPERQGQVLGLILEGRSCKEIASQLNTTLDAVYTLACNGRRTLRAEIGCEYRKPPQSESSPDQYGNQKRARRA